jgi:hypothetical protein
MSAFQYTGSSFFGYRKDPTIDEYDRKQGLRHNRRRPIEETIEELGEGRGKFRESQYILRVLIDTSRHIRSGIRRAKSTENQGALRD